MVETGKEEQECHIGMEAPVSEFGFHRPEISRF